MLPDSLSQSGSTASHYEQWEAVGGQIRTLSHMGPPTFSHVICLSQSGSMASYGLPQPPTWPPMASPHWPPTASHMASQFGLAQPPNSASHSLTWPCTASHMASQFGLAWPLNLASHTASQFGLSHSLSIWPLTASHGLSIQPLTWPLTQPLTRPQGGTASHGLPRPLTPASHTPSQFGLPHTLPIRTPTASHMAFHTASQCGLPHSLSLSVREHSLPQPPTWPPTQPPNLASHGLTHGLAQPCTASHMAFHLSGRLWEAMQERWEAVGGQEFGLSYTQPPTFSHVICLSQSGSTWPPTRPPMTSHTASQFRPPNSASQFGLTESSHMASHGLSQPLSSASHMASHMASQFGLSRPLNLASHMASHSASDTASPLGLREHGLPWTPTASTQPPTCPPNLASQFGLPQPPTWPPNAASHTASHSASGSMASHGLPHGLAQPCTASHMASHLSGRPWEALGGRIWTLSHTASHILSFDLSEPIRSESLLEAVGGRGRLWEAVWEPVRGHGRPWEAVGGCVGGCVGGRVGGVPHGLTDRTLTFSKADR